MFGNAGATARLGTADFRVSARVHGTKSRERQYVDVCVSALLRKALACKVRCTNAISVLMCSCRDVPKLTLASYDEHWERACEAYVAHACTKHASRLQHATNATCSMAVHSRSNADAHTQLLCTLTGYTFASGFCSGGFRSRQ